MSRRTPRRIGRPLNWKPILAASLAVLGLSCGMSGRHPDPPTAEQLSRSVEAWETIYAVLQHPRCVNCHPAGDSPLQGDEGRPHAQNVQRGADGTGRFALVCSNCHQDHNLDDPNLPPGAPHWQLPPPEMPLVFEGRTSGDLCRQLSDPGTNGGRTPEEIFQHMAEDPLVLWGWQPGAGRTPIATPHDELVRAVRTWVDNGCGCPKE